MCSSDPFMNQFIRSKLSSYSSQKSPNQNKNPKSPKLQGVTLMSEVRRQHDMAGVEKGEGKWNGKEMTTSPFATTINFVVVVDFNVYYKV